MGTDTGEGTPLLSLFAGNMSIMDICLHSLLQLVLWSLVVEMGTPVFRSLLALHPSWKAFEGLEISKGKYVRNHLPRVTAVAVWRTTAAYFTFSGYYAGREDLFRFGMTVEVAYRINSFVLGALGVRRFASASWQVRGLMMLYNSFALLLTLAAIAEYSSDSDVRGLASLIICSGMFISILVPLQFVVDITTVWGSKGVFGLQLLNFLVFVWCRFVVSVYGRTSVHSRVASKLFATDKARGWLFVVGIFVVCYTWSGIVVVLLFQRLRKCYHAAKSKVPRVRKHFADNKKDDEKEIHSYIWSTFHIPEILVEPISDMMSGGPWFGMKRKPWGKSS